MATEREANNTKTALPGFVKWKKPGQKVGGKVKKFDSNDNGPFVVLSPAFVADAGESWGRRYDSLPVPLMTDLLRKVDTPDDVGKVLVFTFKDEETTERGNKKKLFNVAELDPSEYDTLRARCVDKGSAVGVPDVFAAR